MLPRELHLYNPKAPLPVAVLSVQLAPERDLYLIEVKRGRSAYDHKSPTVHGPYSADQVGEPFASLTADLHAEGFLRAGTYDALDALASPNAAFRARAALRLGWRRHTPAVPRLLALLVESPEETCSLLDALGNMGDPSAAGVIRPFLTRKLLSRRRSAAEALRQLGDTPGLAQARQIALERLPAELRSLIEETTNAQTAPPKGLQETLLALAPPAQGLAVDTLYELATPPTTAAVRQWFDKAPFEKVHLWRYAKSIFKRTQLRHDPVMFGYLNHTFEARGRTFTGAWAEVRSGYDGQQRATRVFSRNTQKYLKREGWRYLLNLARFRPESYAPTAAEVLIHYHPADDVNGQFGDCHLLHLILWGRSQRFRLTPSGYWSVVGAKKKGPTGNLSEEMFPELWDDQPRAYLRLLGAALLPAVQAFALAAITTRHAEVITNASHAEIVAMLQAPYEPTIQLALAELERRFNPDNPDWDLLYQLLSDERPNARTLGQRWLRLTAPLWLRSTERMAAWLGLPHPNQRALVAELAIPVLLGNGDLRALLADRLIALLQQPEAAPGQHDGYARVIDEALVAECNSRLSVAALGRWLEHGSPAAQTAAARLLAARRDALAELGLERLAQIAQHELASVRAAAHSLLWAAEGQLRADPSILFVLVESEWEDTRRFAFELLRDRIGVASLGLDGITGLLDSNRTDVQDAGADLVSRHFAELPMAELVTRLAQHPHPHLRSFSVGLLVSHLPPGARALEQVRGFCRSALFDLWPQAATKRGVLSFLAARGLEDEEQAAIVASILGDVVRVQGRRDFEQALEALVRIKLAFPQVQATVELPGGAE
jgi:hypothetical protein